MLRALTLILTCQLIGESLVLMLDLPLPGPVLGMLLLFAGLMLRARLAPALENTADTLLGHLPLFFVPAGVGVMAHWDRLAAHWPALLAAVLLGTLITLVVTALTLAGVRALMGRRSD